MNSRDQLQCGQTLDDGVRHEDQAHDRAVFDPFQQRVGRRHGSDLPIRSPARLECLRQHCALLGVVLQ